MGLINGLSNGKTKTITIDLSPDKLTAAIEAEQKQHREQAAFFKQAHADQRIIEFKVLDIVKKCRVKTFIEQPDGDIDVTFQVVG